MTAFDLCVIEQVYDGGLIANRYFIKITEFSAIGEVVEVHRGDKKYRLPSLDSMF